MGKWVRFTNHFKCNCLSYMSSVSTCHHMHLISSPFFFSLRSLGKTPSTITRISHPPTQSHTRHRRHPLTTAQITIWFLYFCAKAAPLLWTKSCGDLTHYLHNWTKLSWATLWGTYMITSEGQKQPWDFKYLWLRLKTFFTAKILICNCLSKQLDEWNN